MHLLGFLMGAGLTVVAAAFPATNTMPGSGDTPISIAYKHTHTTYDIPVSPAANVFPADLSTIPPIQPMSQNAAQSSTFELDTTYTHGTCSFHLKLLQQCVATPIPSHTSTIGLLWSIEDASNQTFVRFAEGVGRFDGAENAKRLSGLGAGPDLFMVYTEGMAHFKYRTCIWDAVTEIGQSGDGSKCGWCNLGGWTKGDLGCGANGTVEAYRVSSV